MVIILMVLLIILLTIAILVALFYRSKAIEFESLYELRKIDYPVVTVVNSRGFPDGMAVTIESATAPKLNKDGSIAKKRGRKPRNENMGNKK